MISLIIHQIFFNIILISFKTGLIIHLLSKSNVSIKNYICEDLF